MSSHINPNECLLATDLKPLGGKTTVLEARHNTQGGYEWLFHSMSLISMLGKFIIDGYWNCLNPRKKVLFPSQPVEGNIKFALNLISVLFIYFYCLM